MSGLPASWTWTTIDETASTSSGGTPSRARPDFYGGPVPWVKSGELNDGLVREVGESITEEGLKNSSAKIFPSGTLCIALYGATVGKVGILTMDAATNQAVCGISPHPQVESKYLFYFFQSQRSSLIRLSQGGAQPNISQHIVRSTVVPMCARREQARIVDEIEKQFTRLDAATTALKRVQANLKRYRASVLKAACEGHLVPTEAELARKEGRDYEPADKLLQRILSERRARWEADTLAKMQASGKPPTDDSWRQKYKEPNPPDTTGLPPLPEGWCWASLDQLAVSVRNGISTKPTLERGRAILRISAVRAMSVNLGDVRFLPDRPEFRQYTLSENDLLFVRYNGNPDISGRCGRVGVTDGMIVHPDKLIRVDICLKGQLSAWVEIAANFGVSRRYLELRTRTTAGQSGVSGEDIKGIPIPLCPLQEAVRITEESDRRLSTQGVLLTAIGRNEQQSQSLRQSILREAFTGQLVTQDPTDERASVLLERIRAERSMTLFRTSKRRSTRKFASDSASVLEVHE